MTRSGNRRRQLRPSDPDQQLGRIHLLWLTGVAAVILIAVVLPRNRRP
jgi:hypothetical protein